MKVTAFVSLLRSFGPVVVGISLGFTLSLISVTWEGEPCEAPGADGRGVTLGQGNAARKPNSILSQSEAGDDFVPRIVTYKPGKESSPGKLFRPQYISTELGIRERLFVGVLTSKDSIDVLGVAVNRTISHHLDNVVFFTGAHTRKLPHGMTVVTHGEDRLIWNMFQTMQYVLDHFIQVYDWFYFVQDGTYTQADRLKALVGHLSMTHKLYMGHPVRLSGGETEGTYCSGEFGYLLSRALLLQLKPFLEICKTDILSARPDEWLGRCISDHTETNCADEHEDLQYYHFEIDKNIDLNKKENVHFKNAVTVHPVPDADLMYSLHKHFTEMELQRTYSEIEKLQAEIKNLSKLAFEGNRSAQWPVGINPPFEPKTRFEVLRWDYFTEDHMYFCNNGSPKCDLTGIDKMDVSDIIETAMGELNKKYKPDLHLKKQQLINGYRRFDPTRGVEYTLDLLVEVVNRNRQSFSVTKRVHLVRPLSQVEIIPMPYVTEATRVYVILPVTVQDREQINQFFDAFAANVFEKADNTVLTLLFIYNPFEAKELKKNDIFASIKMRVNACEQKYPKVKIPWISVKTEGPAQIKIMDIISKKHPVDTLFFIANVNININSEFLNRCRMNSISNWQVFFPIHFQEYNPDVAYHNQKPPATIDLVKDSGYFDRNVFDEACFYNSDYMATRTRMAADIQENEELLESLDIYDLFVKYSSLHVFRAVEPALQHRYQHKICDPRFSEDIYHRCVQSNLERLGSRSQLAVLLFEQEQGNST
ncbi:chondroitin sulfate synthase 2-like [Scleropages formosus]|uniref:Hexosyltransferase n=1 Tax=Scleropages formosus TaxID=113540 RepID=A0A8C9SCG1_SCLFO|nr:chondroitin sulfate synthase 2-like [Scleropages formosus]